MDHQQEELFVLPSGIETLAERVQGLYLEIQDLYKRYRLPWVVGLSGGKDSTAATQLLWLVIVTHIWQKLSNVESRIVLIVTHIWQLLSHIFGETLLIVTHI